MANEVVEILHRLEICVGNIAVKVIANNQDLYWPVAAAATADDGTRVKGLQSWVGEGDSWKIIIIRTIDRRQEASSTFNSSRSRMRALKRLVHHYILLGPLKVDDAVWDGGPEVVRCCAIHFRFTKGFSAPEWPLLNTVNVFICSYRVSVII